MEQKLLSIAIPCYNSEAYMEKCIESLLIGGERVEIIVVNDGSSDRTAEIADRYASTYPSIVKAVHQENGGHGEAVNSGLKHATGLFFKVVDSDDWVDTKAYADIMVGLSQVKDQVDMVISNFVYEKQGALVKTVMKYDAYLPIEKVFSWDEMGKMPTGKYFLMHSVIYKTSVLRECGLQLPKHTFYVDNIFVFNPLPYVHNIYYMNVDFYRYFIGRDDQSVNEKIMISRIDQQLRVNRLMLNTFLESEMLSPSLHRYMFQYLTVITAISSILAIRSKSDENIAKKNELWRDIKLLDEKLYKKMRFSPLGAAVNLPGTTGKKLTVAVYKIAQKVYGFN